jgi:hypothetical protein
MENRLKLLSGAMFLLVLVFSGLVFAQDFSADIVQTTTAGTFRGKIFVTKDKVRMESPESIIITRMDKKTTWVIMPAQKMYIEQPLDSRNITAVGEKFPGEIERTLIGEEMVDGKMAAKYRIVYEVSGKTETIFQWIDKASKMPTKTAAEDGSWITEYKNLNTGTQSDLLFEVPEGYQKFSYQIPSMEDIMKKTGK